MPRKWFVFANCETSDKFARIYSSLILTNFVYFVMFRHFRNEQRTVPDMCPAIVLNLGLLLRTCRSANGQIFFPVSLKPIPGVFEKVISAQLPSPSKEVNCCIIGILLFLITGPRASFDRVCSQK